MNLILHPAKYQVTSNKFSFVKFEDEWQLILNRQTFNAQDWCMLDVLYLPAAVCCFKSVAFDFHLFNYKGALMMKCEMLLQKTLKEEA